MSVPVGFSCLWWVGGEKNKKGYSAITSNTVHIGNGKSLKGKVAKKQHVQQYVQAIQNRKARFKHWNGVIAQNCCKIWVECIARMSLLKDKVDIGLGLILGGALFYARVTFETLVVFNIKEP